MKIKKIIFLWLVLFLSLSACNNKKTELISKLKEKDKIHTKNNIDIKNNKEPAQIKTQEPTQIKTQETTKIKEQPKINTTQKPITSSNSIPEPTPKTSVDTAIKEKTQKTVKEKTKKEVVAKINKENKKLEKEPVSLTYIGNSKTKKFHISSCSSVNKIKLNNIIKGLSKQELMNKGLNLAKYVSLDYK